MFETTERFLAFKLLNTFDTIKNLEFTKGKICYDCLVTLNNNKTALVECKVRNFKIDTYDGYFLEVLKLKSLCKMAKKNNNDFIYYVNFFNTDDCTKKDFIIFNIRERIKKWQIELPEIQKLYMNKATFISNEKTEKEVILLHYDEKIDKKGEFSLN